MSNLTKEQLEVIKHNQGNILVSASAGSGKTHTMIERLKRLIIKENISDRLSQSVETALKLSDGLVFAEFVNDKKREIFSSKFACPISGFTIEEIEPRLFSFNNPYGACPYCDGIGARLYMDPNLIVPNVNLSILYL